MHIFIRDVRNNSFEIDVPDDCTIPQLKQAIADQKHCSVDGMKLLFASKVLQDNFDLTSIQTNDKSRVVLYIKPEKNNTSPTKPAEPVNPPVKEEVKPAPQPEPVKPKPQPTVTHPAFEQQQIYSTMQQQPRIQQPTSTVNTQVFQEQPEVSLEQALSTMKEMGYDEEVAQTALLMFENDVESAVEVISRGFDTVEKLNNYHATCRAQFRKYYDSIYAQIVSDPNMVYYVFQHQSCPVSLPNGTVAITQIDLEDFTRYCQEHNVSLPKKKIISLTPAQSVVYNTLQNEFPNVDPVIVIQYLQACDFDEANTRACLQNE